MGVHRHAGVYRHVDAALVRATIHPNPPLRDWPVVGEDTDAVRWCAWLMQVWADEAVAQAVAAASPVLASRVAAVCRGHRPSVRQARRMALSLARYLVRMRGRATPFALFAGVAPARFGPGASPLRIGKPHVRARADAVWLAGVIARLEACAGLRRRLRFVLNDLAFVRGDRLVVAWQPQTGAAGRATAVQVSVRRNRAVQVVMQAASRPVSGGELIARLAAEIPAAPICALERVLGELTVCGVLITSLRPPSTNPDGLGHVLKELRSVDAAAVEKVVPLVRELAAIHADLDADVPAGGSGWRGTAGRMRALSGGTGQPLMRDVRLPGTVTLPTQVAAAAARAAAALLRLTPYPAGPPGWEQYHARFVARYGTGVLVPVDQLVDGTAGLGFPAHYAEAGQAASRGLSRRDERLLALAQQAALDATHEVVLDDGLLDALAGDHTHGPQSTPPHMAVLAELHAPTPTALTGGDFTLAVTGVGRTGISLTGRFVDLLGEEDRQRLTSLFGRLPTGVEGAIAAQLSFPPRRPYAANVTSAPRLLPDLLAIAEHHDGDPRRLRLPDLVVTADITHLYLVSLSRRRVVEPIVTSAAAPHVMPPITRFLVELPRARRAAVAALSWGAAGCLPFLPRLRYGRVVLTPARWRIPAGALPGREASWRVWRSALDAVRERLGLPAQVSVGHGRQVMRLNLDDPMDLTLLREHLAKAGADACVAEAPSVSDYGWCGGRAHEIVVPLASTTPPAPAPAVVHLAGALPLIDGEDGVLPGAGVLSAKLYGHPDVFDTILIGWLPDLWSAWPDPPWWWFIRYADPRPHLRLRLHLGAGEYGKAADRVGAWAAGLRRRGLAGDLVLDTYHPETARYGPGRALTAAESLFAADSAAVLAQLTARAAARDVHPQAVTAASMVDLASALAGGVPAGMRWLIDHAGTSPGPALDRAVVRDAIRLTDPDDQAALRTIAGGPQIAAAWRARREAATTYLNRLTDVGHVRKTSAFVSLLHMHSIRAHGIDRAAELACHRTARAVALSWTARHPTTTEGSGR